MSRLNSTGSRAPGPSAAPSFALAQNWKQSSREQAGNPSHGIPSHGCDHASPGSVAIARQYKHRRALQQSRGHQVAVLDSGRETLPRCRVDAAIWTDRATGFCSRSSTISVAPAQNGKLTMPPNTFSSIAITRTSARTWAIS